MPIKNARMNTRRLSGLIKELSHFDASGRLQAKVLALEKMSLRSSIRFNT
jgi:hypothetical protein